MDEIDIFKLKDNVKKFLSARNLTQAELSEILHCSQPNIGKKLSPTKKAFFTTNDLLIISKEFNVSIDEILGLREKISINENSSIQSICNALNQLTLLKWAKIAKVDITEGVDKFQTTTNYNAIYFKQITPTDNGTIKNIASSREINHFIGQLEEFQRAKYNYTINDAQYEDIINGIIDQLPKQTCEEYNIEQSFYDDAPYTGNETQLEQERTIALQEEQDRLRAIMAANAKAYTEAEEQADEEFIQMLKQFAIKK